MIKVKCDICDNEFTISEEKIQKKKVKYIEVNYFECENCNHKYITSCYDDYILKEQRRLKKLDEKIVSEFDISKKKKLINKSQKLLKHLKIHSDRLKRDVEKIWII